MNRASFAAIVLICLCTQLRGGELLTYEQHIRPIFRAHCFDCHGASEDLEGSLDLRQVRLMKKGGESGSILDLDDPDESYLLERIRSGEMPPGENDVSASQIETIRQWIAAGAKTGRPESEQVGPGLGITMEERSFWAFQPITPPEVSIADGARKRIRSPIDAIVLTGQSETVFQPDADRRTLIIRAYFDLIGLPPEPNALQEWIQDSSKDWYDRLLTDLLSSPHYGERWARHWLDVAGYADSEGYTTADAVRPWAWKYRDWVVRALNKDKPLDQFITEQLAGDEIAGPQNGDLTQRQIELLTATGFLRMAADGTGSGASDAVSRNQVMTDTMKIIGTSLFGLSIQCAQCHDHRYDPIPQTDYYALRAVFEPALDWNNWKTPAARRVSLYTAADHEKAAEVEAEANVVVQERAKKLAQYMMQAIDAELMKFEEPLRASLRKAYETPATERNDEQKMLLAANPSVNITAGNLYQYLPDSKPKLTEFSAKIAEIRSRKPVHEFLRALIEPPNHVTETKLFFRGDHEQPKQVVLPASLTIAAAEGQRAEFPQNDETLPTTGRRLAFARWLTSRDNRLLSRVIANRVWMHHFGTGLVSTPADFGKLGSSPTNPELLDWLADKLIAQQWSLKQLHRAIMSSTTYRQRVAPETSEANVHRSLRRLEAETIRDRMLAATHMLDPKLFGAPLKVKEDDTGQVVVDENQPRRSLYIQARRTQPVALMQTFDAPVMETNCEVRADSTVATQSLMLLNGQFILDQAAKLADRAAREPCTVSSELVHGLTVPELPALLWQYGFGRFDEKNNRIDTFTPLPHWTGSQYQGGAALPDASLGWALLNAGGGHPDNPNRSVIRRWIATDDCLVQVAGSLSHHSQNGDGVRGRVVLSRNGIAGQWIAANSSTDTTLDGMEVKAGEAIDFVTDCRENYTSDSFAWHVTLTIQIDGQPIQTIESADRFGAPNESTEMLPGQIVRAWQLAYCRLPSKDEFELALQFVSRQFDTFALSPTTVPSGQSSLRQAMTNLCQSLLSSNEFLYVE